MSGTALAVVTAIVLFLKKPLQDALTSSISTWLSTSFQKQLEELRNELSIRERKLEAQLRADQVELADLRSGALSNLSSRNALLSQKRVEAVEGLWAAVIDLRKLYPLAHMISGINFEAAAEGTRKDPQLKKTFEELFALFDFKFPPGVDGVLHRPFLSEKSWDYFECYQLILFDSAIQMVTIKTGVGAARYKKGALLDSVKQKIPEYSSIIEESRSDGLFFLLPALEANILHELKLILGGTDEDQKNVVDAGEIIRLSSQTHQIIKSLDQARLVEALPAHLKRNAT